ncbi:thioredoxin family protein [Aequorivita lipolytica]|uniref:DUF255 domain-containing protein n=1 Tax=Aequorivita lipolytica TaxID=153267 RepID=A0A5C6YTM6_9FLAO|nr:thioredoxin family protein [Aequorivita lipolytica]TXD70375.1 DUF255 domain-containing protein [Aequorivita lipolytica]SRX50804.1 Thiol:disulfide interchange protein DsbD [Aequorivita lipolytica]
MKRFTFHILLLMLVNAAFSQNEKVVHWLNFEQLEDSLATNPKKVFIDFYADWCAPCLKMQREVFTDEKIIEILNEDYYAVKMNVESTDTIHFGNEVFINERANRRNPVHQIPLLMARQKDKPFSLPALVFLDEKFQATARYFQYLNVEQLLKILEKR